MNQTRTLERAAQDAHRRGATWGAFWDQHGAEVCAAEPHDRRKFQCLIRRLLALLVSGNEDGAEPAGSPWLLDSQLSGTGESRRQESPEGRLLQIHRGLT